MRSRWIAHWTPEDPGFWRDTGKRVASRNLVLSVLTEHVGFSIWSLWSVMVLFMGPAYGLTVADKFLLTSIPTLVGAVLRIPYGLAPARFGGRNWTIASALLLLVPAGLCAPVMHPGTSLGVFCLVAAVTGLGGGNFASSMTNINAFYPDHRKGWALGLNAGGGNLGVAVIQLVALLVLATAGALQPRIVLWVYLPLIVLGALGAALFMDNLSTVRNDRRALRTVARDVQCWVLSLLYVGTFGSFIGYAFAFGLVLQNQFHRSPVQAAAVTFLGPLLGSLARPLGGLLADRFGGARITAVAFALMALCAAGLVGAAAGRSLPLYTAGFLLLFVFSGAGNGSTYAMIPAVYQAKAAAAIRAGADETAERLTARRRTAAVIGMAGAIGALGGVGVNLAFRASFAATAGGTPAVIGFLLCYAVCLLVTWLVYLRPAGAPAVAVRPATAEP
jgi:MFS transporter, NNP family, nitrate/nitrite transporter